MNIVISTQVEENYGAHAWDGKGECPQYWKMKGGSEYVVPLTLEQAQQGAAKLGALVNKVAGQHINKDNDYYREYIIDWELVDDKELTPMEKMYAEAKAEGYPMSGSPNKILPYE